MSDDFVAVLTVSRSADPDRGRPHLWPLIIVALVSLAAAVMFFGSRESQSAASPLPSADAERETRIYTVSYRFGVFSPTNLRIHAGDTVRFRNDSAMAIRVVAELLAGERAPEFDSIGQVQPGGYFSYTFPRVGVFGYRNGANSGQTGVIIVR